VSGAQNAELIIRNRLGFHVRPIQRFAELAQAFRSEIEVRIEDRRAPGKSVMNLMTLRGRHGSVMNVTTRGEDARQALGVLEFLVESNFFVENDPGMELDPCRHVTRLAKIASCFNSEVVAELNGKRADARNVEELSALGITPTSKLAFHVSGDDSEQARSVLEKLVKHCFYVESAMGAQAAK